MTKYSVAILLVLFPALAISQVLDYGVPERLSSAINSDAEESMPLLSLDGRNLFFTRILSSENVGGLYSGHDAWFSSITNNQFGKASNKNFFINNKGSNAVIGMRSDQKVLYFLNASQNKPVEGIYFSKKEGDNWSQPEFIPIAGIECQGFVGFYVSPDFDVILISMKGLDSRGEEDLYVSVKSKSGDWQKPRNLGATINTAGYEISPFLSQDKKRLYFASNGHPGFGNADIFYSERLYESWETWSVPKNLGSVVNSQSFDAYFSIYGDSIAFLSSNRSGKNADIYKVEILNTKRNADQESIEKLIQEANAILSDLKETDDRRSIIFGEDSAYLSESAKTDLNQLVSMISNSSKPYEIEILAYFVNEKDKEDPESLFSKRIAEIRKFLDKASLKSLVRISMQEANSKLQSSRYVFVTARAR